MRMINFELELADLVSQNLYRNLSSVDDGVHNFSSNDYLGYSQNINIKNAALNAINSGGVSQASSRLVAGNTVIHELFEKELALAKKQEQALIYSSGYQANLGVISALVGKKDLLILDKLSHASLIDSANMTKAKIRIFPHKNLGYLTKILENNHNKFINKFLITDSVFSMDGDLALIEEMQKILLHYQAYMIVDEAHAVGVLGSTGMGLLEQCGLKADNIIETGTLSKAFGCVGGYVVGSASLIKYLINKSRNFIYDTAIPAHIIASARVALQMIIEGKERAILWENINYLQNKLNMAGFKLPQIQSAIVPIIIGKEERAMAISSELKNQNIYVPAIRYPTVSLGKARLRITVTAKHQKSELDSLVEQLKNAVI